MILCSTRGELELNTQGGESRFSPLGNPHREELAGTAISQSSFYVSENLGADSCGAIQNVTTNSNENQLVMAQYYRITLYAAADAYSATPLILQSTLAIPSKDNISCKINPHFVSQGRQMLRILIKES